MYRIEYEIEENLKRILIQKNPIKSIQMKDKKTAKKIIKITKTQPNLYTKEMLSMLNY